MRLWPVYLFAALVALIAAISAEAQVGAPSACGPTSVGGTAVTITYPASGQTGPSLPTQYLTLANPSASAYFCVNAQPGGTAATSGSGCAAGSIYLGSLGVLTWRQPMYPPPATVSIIASASSTPLTCLYQ